MKDSLIGRKDICRITVSFLLTPRPGSDIAHCKKGSCGTPNASPLGTPLCLLSQVVGKADLPFSPAVHFRCRVRLSPGSQLASLALLSAITCTTCPFFSALITRNDATLAIEPSLCCSYTFFSRIFTVWTFIRWISLILFSATSVPKSNSLTTCKNSQHFLILILSY